MTKKKKNPAAVALGKLGGKIGGKATGVKKGLAMVTPERRLEIAMAGVAARNRNREAAARSKKAAAKKQAKKPQ
jgi:hypothetical protein